MGALGGLGVGDWSLTVISQTAIDVVFTPDVPGGAQGLIARYRETGTVPWVGAAAGATSPAHATGLTAATEYDFEVAWSVGGFPVSGWSDRKTATTNA